MMVTPPPWEEVDTTAVAIAASIKSKRCDIIPMLMVSIQQILELSQMLKNDSITWRKCWN